MFWESQTSETEWAESEHEILCALTLFGKHCGLGTRLCSDLPVRDWRTKMLAFRRLCGGLRVSQSVQRGGTVRSLLARGLSSESDAHLRVELLDDEHKGTRTMSCKDAGHVNQWLLFFYDV